MTASQADSTPAGQRAEGTRVISTAHNNGRPVFAPVGLFSGSRANPARPWPFSPHPNADTHIATRLKPWHPAHRLRPHLQSAGRLPPAPARRHRRHLRPASRPNGLRHIFIADISKRPACPRRFFVDNTESRRRPQGASRHLTQRSTPVRILRSGISPRSDCFNPGPVLHPRLLPPDA